MFKTYLGAVNSGRLASRPFIVNWLILVFAFVVFGFAIGSGIGIAEQIVGGDLIAAQKFLRDNFALPVIIVLAIIVLLFLFAKLNIIAKRARDAGLPGWVTALGIALMTGVVGQATGNTVGTGSIGMVLLVILAFIPSDQFKNANSK